MLCSFSWQLLFHLFLSIPIAYADWNFGPQATDNKPSPPAGFATNNGLPKDLTLDPAMVEDFSARAFDQSQGNTISNGFELSSVQIDGTIPEGLIMAEGGEGCLPNDGRSSRKMRVRRDQGVCEWNTPQQFRNVPQTPNTEQQKKPQGQITGGKKPPGDRKKRKTSVTVVRLTPNKEKEAELWFPKENRPKSDKGRCRMPEYDIPVCAYFADSIEMFPAVMGLGPVCILVPATALPCVDRQIEWCCQLVEVAFTGRRITFQDPNPFMLYAINCIKNDGSTPLVIEMPEDPPSAPETKGPF